MKPRTSQINVEFDSKTRKILNKRIDYLQRNRVMLLYIICESITKISLGMREIAANLMQIF